MHTLVAGIIASIQEYQSSGPDKITDFQGKQIIYTEKLVIKKLSKITLLFNWPCDKHNRVQ